MSLLHLPNELFRAIIDIVIADEGILKATYCRTVCKSFAYHVADRTFEVVAATTSEDIFDDAKLKQLFRLKPCAILCRKVLCYPKPETNYVVHFARTLAEWLPRSKDPTIPLKYTQCVADVCVTVTAINFYDLESIFRNERPGAYDLEDPLRICQMSQAVAAGIRDETLLKKITTQPTDLTRKIHLLLPDALSAAVASRNVDLLQYQLRYLEKSFEGGHEMKYDSDIRRAAKPVGFVLRLVLRLGAKKPGRLLLDFFEANRLLRMWNSEELGERLFRDAVRFTQISASMNTLF